MELHQFRAFVERHGDLAIRSYLDVSPATFRRWKTGQSRIPHSAIIAMRLHFEGDLSALGGEQWEHFRFGSDGLLYLPGWKYGWTAGAVRGLFFTRQLADALQKDLAASQKALQDVSAELARERLRAEGYKRAAARNALPVMRIKPVLRLVADNRR
ncbi:MAG TPA: hypothetical protein VK149_12595 [Sideroxyarcus sp.]|nr:hypothetical protein [Sideroxyarcus sp.]